MLFFEKGVYVFVALINKIPLGQKDYVGTDISHNNY